MTISRSGNTDSKEHNLKMFLIALGIMCALAGCSYINKWFFLPDDNPIEEAIEDIIEMKTGLKVDLTPEDPEK